MGTWTFNNRRLWRLREKEHIEKKNVMINRSGLERNLQLRKKERV
jgi:hypothetical protein